jgi:hypothetical protein
MKSAAVVFNVVLVAFTCLVMLTDGPPTGAVYIALTFALVLVPILSLTALLRRSGGDGHPGTRVNGEALIVEQKEGRLSPGSGMRTAAILCNIVMFGLSCWALVDRYPHPEEDGFVAYVLVVVVTPILSVVALLRSGSGAGRRAVRAG